MTSQPPAAPVDSPRSAARLFRLAAAAYLVLALAGVFWIGLRDGRVPLALLLDPQAWLRDLGKGLSSAAGLVLAWELARRASRAARTVETELAATLGRLSRSEQLGLALLSGFAEELFFRGAMLPAWGLLATTLAFGLLHVGPRLAYVTWTMFALLGGLLFGVLARDCGNLLAPICAHVAVNAVGLWRLGRRLPAGGPLPGST